MDTIRILNNYRLSLTDDKSLFQILSKLYYNGPTEEEELISKIELSSEESRMKLSKLFQSGFIERAGTKNWIVTSFAEDILSSYGIPEIAAKSLLLEFDLLKEHRTFLEGCIELQANTKSESARYCTSALRSYLLTKDILKNKIDFKFINDTRPLYTIIIGLDPEAKRVDYPKYCSEVFNWHETKNTEWWNKEAGNLEKFKNYIINNCEAAVHDVNESELILRSASKWLKNDVNIQNYKIDHSIFITLVRLITSIVRGVPDSGLYSAYKINNNLPSNIWDFIEGWSPGIEKDVEYRLRHYLFKSPSKDESREGKYSSGKIRDKMTIIMKKVAQKKEAHINRYPSDIRKSIHIVEHIESREKHVKPTKYHLNFIGRLKNLLTDFVKFLTSLFGI